MDRIVEQGDTHDESGKGEHDASGKGDIVAKPTGKRAARQGVADKFASVDPNADSVDPSKVPGQSGMREAVSQMFAGQDLSEDFMSKAETIFEAVLSEKVAGIVSELEEEFETRLDEELEAYVNELVERVDDYLNYTVSHYMSENAIAIESGIQVEMAESFMEGLKSLYLEHNVTLDDEKMDVVAEMAEQLSALEEQINKLTEANMMLEDEMTDARAAAIFAEVAEGLTMGEVDRLSTMSEGVEFDNLDTYKNKLEVIKENFFGSKQVFSESFDEEPIEVANETYLDPGIAAVVAAISKSSNK